jgi:hypothetical protein
MKWDEMTSEQKGCLVAEKVMGWHINEYLDYPGERMEPDWVDSDGCPICEVGNWNPSESMTDAFYAVEQAGHHVELSGHFHTGWKATVGSHVASAWIAPDSVCLAVLKAVGVDIE